MNGLVEVPGCRGAFVQELLSENSVQVLKVIVEKGGEIPVHSHECAATMIVVSGRATALGKNRRIAKKGDVIVKKAGEPHGFAGIEEEFEFISVSDGNGIKQGSKWDMEYL